MKFRRVALHASLCVLTLWATGLSQNLGYGTVRLDAQSKLLPRTTPEEFAYDRMLDSSWACWLRQPASYSGKQMYYFYCGFRDNNMNTPDTWTNDVGEKVPVMVRSALAYYAYTGNTAALNNIIAFAEYARSTSTTSSSANWPNMPQTTADAGETVYNGFSTRFPTNAIHVDQAADMAYAYFKLYLYNGNTNFRDHAVNVANTLVSKMQTGTASKSPWPYVVNASSGAVVSDYCSNFFQAVELFDELIAANVGNVASYQTARTNLKNWLLTYPMQNGLWVDGHGDNLLWGTGNLSNTTKSNACLYLLDNPTFDPNFATNIPRLLQWTEDNMSCTCPDQFIQYGAHVPAEQVCYKLQMGYQTARLAAEYAMWYKWSGNATHMDMARRAANYWTYMVDDRGMAKDGNSDGVGWWFSDCYGEATSMFYYVYSAFPEWAPPRENHLLYSKSVIKSVAYATSRVDYTPSDGDGIEYLRLAFLPSSITVNGAAVLVRTDLNAEGYTTRSLGAGDYAVTIRRTRAGAVAITSAAGTPPTVVTGASATPNPVTATTAALSVLGSDDGGEANLTYSWNTTSTPSGGIVSFSASGTNGAKTTTATFNKSGAYVLRVTIADLSGQSVTSSVTVTVNQTLSAVTVSPSSASVATSATQQFTAAGRDQFGGTMTATCTWNVNGGGTISSTGLFTAGTTVGGPYTVTATSGSRSGTASVSVAAPSSTLYRVNCGGPAVSPFTADQGFSGGNAYTSTNAITTSGVANAALAAVYQTERWGNATYTLGALTASAAYTVRLHFAEIYWTAAGARTFNVTVNGTQVLSAFDIYVAAGSSNKAVVRDFAANANASGQMVIQFTTVKDNAKVSGIEILAAGPVNNAPTVATVASATPSPATGTTTSLSVLGTDDGGEAALTYTWAASAVPSGGAATFSVNGTNAARNTTATFTKAGSYTLQATIKDAGNLTVVSGVTVTVSQTLTTLTISPTSASVAVSATRQFSATGSDQFGAAMSVTPSWSVSGGGSISASGLFTAGTTAGGPYTVTATSSSRSATASVTVTAASGGFLGNNTVGSANDASGANDLNCWRFQAATSFTATAMKINLASMVSGKMKLAIYADNAGSPGALLMGTVEVTNPASEWATFTLTSSQSITAGTYYWLSAWSNANYTPRQAPTGGNARYVTRTYGTWPTPLSGTQGPYSGNESIYAY